MNKAAAFRHGAVAALLATLLAGASLGALAQDPGAEDAGDAPRAPEVRRAMEDYFLKRLRVDLDLSDAQMAAVGPRLVDLGRTRTELAKERARLRLELRRGLRNGASDDALERSLEALQALDARERAESEARLAEVDRELSVRQRAELRVFLERFRREMAERVRELRRERRDRRSPRR